MGGVFHAIGALNESVPDTGTAKKTATVMLGQRENTVVDLSEKDLESGYGTIYRDIPYGDTDSNLFDLYIPADAEQSQPQGVILSVHGGNWNGGNRQYTDALCREYMEAGYITATMEYTLMKEGDDMVTANLKMVDEINACIAKIKDTLEEKGYTAGYLALYGASAGGQLVLLYSYTRAEDSAIPLAFVVSQCGPASMKYWFDAETEDGASVVERLSPINYVRADSVPTLLSHGRKDSLVPYETATDLIVKLEEYQVPYAFVDFPNSGHDHANDPECILTFREKMLEFCKTYFGY